MKEVDNENDLTNVLRGSDRIFALFYASWCPFCRSFLPVFMENNERKKLDYFVRIKIDDEGSPLWGKYGIEVVPTIIHFDCERISRRLDGVFGEGLSEKQFRDFI